jgi:hypothetical protein
MPLKNLFFCGMAVILFCVAGANADEQMLGMDFSGFIYNVNSQTGALSNSRNTAVTDGIAGFAVTPNGVSAYILTTFGGFDGNSNSLFSVNTATGTSTMIGATGLSQINEGDMTIRPSDGKLFACSNLLKNGNQNSLQMFTLNPATGAATVVGTVETATQATPADISGLAFSPAGDLFAMDNDSLNLLRIDPATASILQTIPLTGIASLGSVAGLAFNPQSGVLYMADGTSNVNNANLYTIDPSSGAVTLVGSTGIKQMAALTFTPAQLPEPGMAGLVMIGAAALSMKRRRRQAHFSRSI